MGGDVKDRGTESCECYVVVWLVRRWNSLEQWLGDFRTEIDPSCIPLIQVVAAKCDLAANAQQVSVASSP